MPSVDETAAVGVPRARYGRRARLASWIVATLLSVTPAVSLAAEAPASGEQTHRQVAELGSALAGQGVAFSYEIYQVRAGDTVENIAARFGVSAIAVRQLNSLDEGQVSPGQSIAIPLSAKPAARPVSPSRPALNLLEPCYAVVRTPCRIQSQPSPDGTEVLYEPQVGSQLIVNAEQGDYLGVVMIDGSAGWVQRIALEMTGRTLPADQLESMLQGGRPDVVQEALRYLGTPYRYGGRLPQDVDCSLLVQTAFAARGTRLPRTAASQYEVGRSVNYNELLPGDRLYFVSKSGRINHTGIYLGNGRFVHASARRGRVAVDSLYDRLYWSRFLGARR